ncbi:MAG: response regulator [Phycisphaerae bacterium]|nr:response regulator [Phycisphaerae bacterium]
MSHAVLVIDDEQHILRSLKRLLHRDGYEIHLADNGNAALEIMADTEIAVIICDQRMPGMPGAEVLAESVKLRPDAFRITLTGYTDMESAQKSINKGCVNHFLLKPWDDEHLREVVRNGVKAYQLIQDNRRLEKLTREQKAKLEQWNKRLEEQVRRRTEELEARNRQLLDLRQRVEQSLRDTVGVLAGLMEAHDPNAGLHSKRVADFASALGLQLVLADQELRDLEFAARLHDIGKLSKLHARDVQQSRPAHGVRETNSRRYCESGSAILSHVAGFENVAQYVLHQHEHYDGSGFPEHLKEDEIPLASRIIAVVNAYDEAVYTSARPTDPRHGVGRKLLVEDKSKQFDPDLVKLFLSYLDKGEAKAKSADEVELSPRQLTPGMTLSRAVCNTEGVLLIKPGVTLTRELIEHIRELNHHDPLLNSVFVKCTPDSTVAVDDSKKPQAPRREETNKPASDAGRLPVDHDEQPAMAEGLSCSGTATACARINGLIVDDSNLMRRALAREFHRAGFIGTTTGDGWEALNLVYRGHFDVALIDLAMPTMSGTELVRRLREIAPQLPCIIVTGNATKDDVVHLSKSPNVAGILTKPWDYDRLVSTVTAAVKH